ncbi:reverse transcriptase domain-containing protein [Tanacetum coccineum]
MTVITNEENELIPTRLVTGWRETNTTVPRWLLALLSVSIDPKDQGKDNIYMTIPELLLSVRMPFGLCNAPGTFQRCMMAIFHDMIEKTMEVFMDDFSVFGDSFSTCLTHLEKMLKRCEDTNLSLNWEKSHFMICDDQVIRRCVSGASSFRHSQSFATVEPTGGTLWCQITQQEKSSIQDFPDCEDSRACSILHEFHILSFILGIQNSITKIKTKKQSQNAKLDSDGKDCERQ